MLREVWTILTPQQRRWVAAAQLLSLVMACSTVAGIVAIGPFFAVLGNPSLVEQSPALHWVYTELGAPSRQDFALYLGAAFIALVLIANVINLAGAFALTRLARSIGYDFQTTLFAGYLDRPHVFHTESSSVTLVNKIILESNVVTAGILLEGLTLVVNVVTAALIVLSIMVLNPMFALAMLAALAGGYVLIYIVLRRRLLSWGRLRTRFAAEQARVAGETLGAIKEVTVLGVQHFFRRRFELASAAIANSLSHISLVSQAPRYVMECVAVTGLAGVALLLLDRSSDAGAWLGQLTFLGFAAYRLLPMLQQIFAAVARIRASRAAFDAIAPDLRFARVSTTCTAAVGRDWRGAPEREIRVKNASFRYSDDRRRALEDVSLCIPAGSSVAFVGANGSGKTTLADLIAGLLEPSTGEVEIDGIKLDSTNRTAWQSRIAYVPQNVFLLDATVAANIALGVPAAEIDRERLHTAARIAQIHDLVCSLPGGYEYRVGERGAKLSGGQRQRIGIARALYREASVLMLDEATNALDSMAEEELTRTLLGLRGRYTTLLISHRQSSAGICDAIIELAEGRIVAAEANVADRRNLDHAARARAADR